MIQQPDGPANYQFAGAPFARAIGERRPPAGSASPLGLTMRTAAAQRGMHAGGGLSIRLAAAQSRGAGSSDGAAEPGQCPDNPRFLACPPLYCEVFRICLLGFTILRP